VQRCWYWYGRQLSVDYGGLKSRPGKTKLAVHSQFPAEKREADRVITWLRDPAAPHRLDVLLLARATAGQQPDSPADGHGDLSLLDKPQMPVALPRTNVTSTQVYLDFGRSIDCKQILGRIRELNPRDCDLYRRAMELR